MRSIKPPLVSKIRRNKNYGSIESWRELSYKVKRRDNFECVKCGSNENIEAHHVIPLSKGGKNNMLNLVTLCSLCHAKIPGHSHRNLRKHRLGF